MATLPRVQPRCFYDLVIEVALIRPGPIQGGSVHPYIRRRNGTEPVTYLHPLLEPALETLGVPLFQEQLMQIAIDVAGFTPAEADELRQAMGAKRSGERMARLRDRLFAGMAERRHHRRGGRADLHKLAAFANFGFPESHSVSFAYLVYSTAWFKLHYPAAFCAGLLNAQPMGFWSPQTLVADARRHGVVVRRPDVNAGRADACLEPERTGAGRRGRPTSPGRRPCGSGCPRCAASGRRRPSGSRRGRRGRMEDLVRRAGVTRAQLEALATAGALDGLGAGAPTARASGADGGPGARERRAAGHWCGRRGRSPRPPPTGCPGWSPGRSPRRSPTPTPWEEVAADLWALGMAPDTTAVELARGGLDRRGVIPAAALAGRGRPGTG